MVYSCKTSFWLNSRAAFHFVRVSLPCQNSEGNLQSSGVSHQPKEHANCFCGQEEKAPYGLYLLLLALESFSTPALDLHWI